MNCENIGERLIDLATGLPTEPQVEAHLRACGACAGRLREMRQTMALLDEWKAPEPSPYFDTRLQARLREEAARPRGWMQWFRKPALAAVVAVLLVLGGTLYTTGRHPQSARTVAQMQPGSAVQDLQDLDKNSDLYANFDLLDELGNSPDTAANP